MKRILFFSALFFAACSSEPKQGTGMNDTTAAVPDGTAIAASDTLGSSYGRFLIYYNQLVSSIGNNDARTFNNFIHPDFGLCIIEQNGAMPQMKNGKDISRFRTIDGKNFFEMEKSKLRCELMEEELPVVDCDKPALWSKAGCFTQEVNTFKDDKIWEYCGLQQKEQDVAAKSAATITRTVINTNGLRFYFSEIEGKWYLTFIDLRIPCSA